MSKFAKMINEMNCGTIIATSTGSRIRFTPDTVKEVSSYSDGIVDELTIELNDGTVYKLSHASITEVNFNLAWDQY